MARSCDIGQPEGVTVLAPPEGYSLERFKERVMKLRNQGVPYYNASRIVREQILELRDEDGATLLNAPHAPLRRFSDDDEHTPEKIHRRTHRLVASGRYPADPDGKPIRDRAVQDASAKHGDRFWRKADEIFARGGVSKILSRHLAAQELR